MTILEAALNYLSADISVLPTKKDKTPAMGRWTDLQTTAMDEETANNAFTHSSAYGIAVICGKVSGGLECIDFDSHDNDIEAIVQQWYGDEGVKDILNRNKCYVEMSPRGGYHVLYRYESDDKYDGNQKLANWSDGTTMIETRGEGGYVITAPTPGCMVKKGSLENLPTITIDERDFLLEKARELTQVISTQSSVTSSAKEGEVKGFDGSDPVSWFNWNRADYAKKLLEEAGWARVNFNEKEGVENWRRPGKEDGISATFGKKHNALYVFSSSAAPFKNDCYYTPFQILTKLRFKEDFVAATKWIQNKYFDTECPYIRVGISYYKVIRKPDRFGINRTELKVWNKDEIKLDEGAKYLEKIPKFDDFTMEPDNFTYTPVLHNCYNLYKEFSHKPSPGQWTWTEVLLRHVFGEQYDLGIRYLQALYLHPKRMLPILVLVSKERQTGKTTFLNWLNVLFGDNMVNISPEDLASSFNHIYATSNIIGIEETLIEKSITVEKLKALATGKFISVNQKWVSQYKTAFYGKIVMCSNNEDKFARIDQEEIRFFIRKLSLPKVFNHRIEEDMISEIPAFLDYLIGLPAIDWTRDRSGFTPEEISNEMLVQVKEESRTGLYKELYELIADWFYNHNVERLEVIPADIKSKWFHNNSRIDINYIRHVLKREFDLKPLSVRRYIPFDEFNSTVDSYDSINNQRVGAPFCFFRDDFIKTEDGNLVPKVNVERDGLPF